MKTRALVHAYVDRAKNLIIVKVRNRVGDSQSHDPPEFTEASRDVSVVISAPLKVSSHLPGSRFMIHECKQPCSLSLVKAGARACRAGLCAPPLPSSGIPLKSHDRSNSMTHTRIHIYKRVMYEYTCMILITNQAPGSFNR